MVTFTLSGTGLPTLPTVRLPGIKCRNTRSSPPRHCKGTSCVETFYRVASVLSAVTLQVALPPACTTGPCAPLTLVADSCSGVYADQPPTVISKSDFYADAYTCAGIAGTLGIITQPQQPMLAVRSSADPRITAGQLTQCTFMFGATAKQTRGLAIGLLSAGSIVMCCCFFVMLGASNDDGASDAKTEPAAPELEVFVPQQPPVVVVYVEQPPQAPVYGVPQQPVYGEPQQPQQYAPQAYGEQVLAYGQQQPYGEPATENVEVPPPPVAPAGPAGGRGRGRGRGRAPVAPGRGGRGPRTPRSSQQGGAQPAHPPPLMPLPPAGAASYDKTQY